MNKQKWPGLELENWEETYELLHLITQVIGKIKIQYNPFKNHWWNISLLPTVDGISSGMIPCEHNTLEIKLNFHNHQIEFSTNDEKRSMIQLRSGSIADYYSQIKKATEELGIIINIWPVPVEIEDRAPFDKDTRLRNYNAEYAARFHTVLLNSAIAMEKFRSKFTGKASPVHFFWGAFDLAVTFFNGNEAPEHPGAPNVAKDVMVKSYNEELASFGFWPGKGLGEAAYYAYTYPVLEGIPTYRIEPAEAYFTSELNEFLLPYKAVKDAENGDDKLQSFFESAYSAAIELGNWGNFS